MKKLRVLILSILGFMFSFSYVGASSSKTVKADGVTYDATVKLGDIPSSTIAASYGAIVKDGISIQAYAGYFNDEGATNNFDLVKFDGGSGNSITCSSKSNLVFENWQYATDGNSVVIEITATAKGTLVFDTSACTSFGGGIDWNSKYIIRKLLVDGTLTPESWNYHADAATIKTAFANGYTQDLEQGDKVYLEFGADHADWVRNFQNMHDATINYTKYVAPKEDLTLSTISFNDLPYYTSYYDYGTIKTTDFTINTYAGFFDDNNAALNYGLVAFDGKYTDSDGEERITCSTKSGLEIKNWAYYFNGNSIVYAFKAGKKGVFTLDYSQCTIGGWIDWNSKYIARKYTAKDGSLSTLVWNFQSDDGTALKESLTKKTSYLVEEGDILYVEYGASADRNTQGLNGASITFAEKTPEMESAIAEMNEAYNSLYNTDYTADDYAALKTSLDENVALVNSTVDVAKINEYKEAFLNKIEETKTYIDYYNIPYFVNANNFGYYNGKFVSYSAYTGNVRNLTVYDTKSNEDKIMTSSTTSDVVFENWQYVFTANNAAIFALKANKDVKVNVVKPTDAMGYMDDSLYNVYLLTNDKIYLLSSCTPTKKEDITKSYYLKQNDVLYFEYIAKAGVEGTRNFQHNGMTLTAYTDFDETAYNAQNAIINAITTKSNDLDTYVGTLNESDYSAASWATIVSLVNKVNMDALNALTEEEVNTLFATATTEIDAVLTIAEAQAQIDQYRTTTLASLKEYYDALVADNHYLTINKTALDNAYNQAVAAFASVNVVDDMDTLLQTTKDALDAIEIDALYEDRQNAISALETAFNALVASYFDETAYTAVQTSINAFKQGVETYTTKAEIEAARDLINVAINALVPNKYGITYLDIPAAIYANEYGWVSGSLFDYTVKTGNVEDGLLSFDTYDANENALTLSTVLGTKLQNWKWFIMPSNGITMVYKANQDIKLTITDSRVGGNGWADDCTLIYYIVRGEEIKTIKEVAAPSTNEDFSGSFYLKAGDILYVEFNTEIASSTRNAEAPCDMVALASKDFDEDAYIAQNHDLPRDVKAEVETKIQALKDYVAGLDQDAYSLSNWAQIEEIRDTFENEVADKVETIADVTSEYNDALADIQAVKTKVQVQEELEAELATVKEELKAAYDELVNNNNYSKENRAALDKAYNDALAEIDAAKSKVAANSVKVKVIQTMNAIEKEEKNSIFDFGCEGGIATTPIALVALIAIILGKKKEEK